MRLTAENERIRAENVSASEVGALLGEHPYMTPEGIYDRLKGLAPEREANEAMDTGSFMEGAILRLAEKRLKVRARANSRTYVHPQVRLCATPDALVLGTPPGLIECKLSGRVELWRTLPEYVEWQVRAQMACTNRDTVAVCVLVGAGLRTFLLIRDPLLEAQLLEAVDTFWSDHIVPGIRPETPVKEIEVSFK
jgi:putative phage-type endonuclease